MDKMTVIAIVASAGWAACEILNQIPAIKANSVFQFVFNLLGTLTGKKTGV